MTVIVSRSRLAVVIALTLLTASARAAETPTTTLLDVSVAGAEQRVKPNWGTEKQVSMARSDDPAAPGLVVTIQPGQAAYPGIEFKPEGAKAWDLSAYGHVEARVVNTSKNVLPFNLRVDNAGDFRKTPWNTELVYLKPGERRTVTVIFGYQYGYQPGYRLNPKEVVNIVMCTTKVAALTTFRVESLVAGGPPGEKPPLNPGAVRVKPKSGVILGPGADFDAAVEIGHDTMPWNVARPGDPLPDTSLKVDAQGGARGSVDGQTAKVVFPVAKGEQAAVVKPAVGRWDLRDALEIRVKLKNVGQAPATPNVQALSSGGPTDLIAPAAPLAPGAEQEIVIPFAAVVPFKGISPVPKPGYYFSQPGPTKFTSDTVTGIRISARHDGEAALLVETIVTDAPPADLPEWLGKRPPVDGDWVKTFDDEFDGSAIDQTKWAIYGPNYWDWRTHWSKDNVIVGDGVVKLRYAKKHGYHNDDPKPIAPGYNKTGKNESDYACGFLETYGKWVQRYGYFEARIKLPTAPGLWPAFWMTSDRGVKAGPQWKRQDNGHGGMEFDIVEQLTRWGKFRHNAGIIWDGYGKKLKSVGQITTYSQFDKDGFITAGMLWLPGLVVYYSNGKEMLRWEDPRVSNVPADVMFTVPVGGWDNNSVDDKQLPADFAIDYVRVWQRKDLASSVDGYQPQPKPEAK